MSVCEMNPAKQLMVLTAKIPRYLSGENARILIAKLTRSGACTPYKQVTDFGLEVYACCVAQSIICTLMITRWSSRSLAARSAAAAAHAHATQLESIHCIKLKHSELSRSCKHHIIA